MRILVLGLILLSATSAYAAYSNDSSSVDINYTGPAADQTPGGGGGSNGGNTNGGDTGGSTNGGSQNGSENGSETGGSGNSIENSDDVTVPVTVITEGSGNGNGGGLGGGLGSEITAEDILSTLRGSQALTFQTGGGGGWGTITISGAKAREALKARGISRITIATSFRNKFWSRGDLTITAVSQLLENPNLEEIIISLDVISLEYKANGRLFAMFPMDYRVRISVNPYGTTTDERVLVKFPWYSFFLQTFISKTALQRQIDASVVAVLADEASTIDARSRLFSAVTETIRSRFDTVEGSL